jgi:predicted RNA-binding protein YlxR (DUF448 family)
VAFRSSSIFSVCCVSPMRPTASALQRPQCSSEEDTYYFFSQYANLSGRGGWIWRKRSCNMKKRYAVHDITSYRP